MSTNKNPEQRAESATFDQRGGSVVVADDVALATRQAEAPGWDDGTTVTPAANVRGGPEENPMWEEKTMLSPAAPPPVKKAASSAAAAQPGSAPRGLASTMVGAAARAAPPAPVAAPVAPQPAAPIASLGMGLSARHSAGEAGGDSYLNSIIADRYKILSKLGEGGMGTVYLAEHIIIEKKVALKVLSDDFARKADLVQRFIQEAKAASRIGHENIVDITDFGETPSGSVFIAMEYLEGKDLAVHIREAGAIPFERCRTIVTQICRALGAAHAKGIIHRDMKPENVYLIEREGRKDFVKILDFGIAKVSSLDNEGGARLTRTGMIFGTPEYMSPEQARGDSPDHRVDIYAVGCILYEMLTGDVPFHSDTFMGVLTKHMFEVPEPPSLRAPGNHVAADVEAVVMKALAKDRDSRFQTMKDMSTALAACAGMSSEDGWGNEPSGVMELPFVRRGGEGAVSSKPPAGARPLAAAPPTTTTTPAGEAKSKLPFVALAAVGLGALIIGSAIYLREPKPPLVDTRPVKTTPVPTVALKAVVPPPPAAPTKVTITINSTPSGAEIYRGKDRLGYTPTSLVLPVDTHPAQLLLKKHEFRDREIDIIADRDRSYETDLQLVKKSISPKGSTSKPVMEHVTAPTKTAPTKQGAGKLRDLKDPFGGDDRGNK